MWLGKKILAFRKYIWKQLGRGRALCQQLIFKWFLKSYMYINIYRHEILTLGNLAEAHKFFVPFCDVSLSLKLFQSLKFFKFSKRNPIQLVFPQCKLLTHNLRPSWGVKAPRAPNEGILCMVDKWSKVSDLPMFPVWKHYMDDCLLRFPVLPYLNSDSKLRSRGCASYSSGLLPIYFFPLSIYSFLFFANLFFTLGY